MPNRKVNRSVSTDRARSSERIREQQLSAQKRGLSPELSTKQSKNNKKPKTVTRDAKEMEEIKEFIKNSLIESTATINNSIQSSQASLETKLNDLSTKLEAEVNSIKSCVNEFKTDVNNELCAFKNQLNEHSMRIDNTQDEIERLKRSLDLRLTGFPPKDGENLSDYIVQIASETGFNFFTQANFPLIDRIIFRDKKTGQITQTNTIMIHFAQLKLKQAFYSHYLSKMPLNPMKFGLSGAHPIVLGENLTKTNAQLFKLAYSFKKTKKIAQVFTEDGLVKVRMIEGKNEPLYIIRNIISLETLIAQHESNAQLGQLEDNNNSMPHSDITPQSNALATVPAQQQQH